MIKFDELALKDVLHFKTANFKFTKGLSVIYGLNRASSRNSKNGNAAGKSALMSQLSEILYDQPTVGVKQDRLKSGTRTLHVTLNKKKTKVIKSGTKLSVEVEGKPVARTAPLTKAWLKKHFPLTDDDFNTYVYLDGRIGHPLVSGSSSERKRFFTEFFRIDTIDKERKLVNAEYAALKKVRTQYNELKREFDSIKQLIIDDDLPSLEEQLQELDTKLKKVQKKAEASQEVQRVITFIQASKEQYAEFKRLAKNGLVPSLEMLTSYIENLHKTLDDFKQSLTNARRYESWKDAKKEYNKAIQQLPKDVIQILEDVGYEKALETAKNKYRKYSEASDRIIDLRKPEKPEPVEDPGVDYNELLDMQSSLSHQLEHAKKFGKGRCPTCGQDVKIKNPEKLEASLDSITKKLKKARLYRDYLKKLDEYKTDIKEYKAKKEVQDELRSTVEANKDAKRIYRALRELPKDPGKFKGEKADADSIASSIERVKDRIRNLDFIRENYDLVARYEAIKDSPKAEENYSDLVNKLNEKRSKVLARIEVVRTYRDRLKQMRKRLLKYKEQLADEEALELLLKAYNDKAMKKMAVNAISSHLMQQVNKYARLVFTEDYRFEFVWDKSNLSILVHRKDNKGVLTSDVRKLSGAESKLFTLVLVISMLAFVPKSKRSSLLVLDEPTANMSEETIQNFKELLPVMNKLIPSIVIITPRSEERYEGARNVTVLKTRDGAKLVEGHPSSITG